MIRINQLKVPINQKNQDLRKDIIKILRCKEEQVLSYKIKKQSIDARKKNQILYIYTIDVEVEQESSIYKKIKNPQVQLVMEKGYQFPKQGAEKLKTRPIIIGSGPAGLYCGLLLAQQGYAPMILERGESVEHRQKTVDRFWETGELVEQSNVQFGEGGAGTFSDGKLNTLVKDKESRNQKVLEVFVEHGAPEEILYLKKPHIGTDILQDVVKNIRQSIIKAGGDVRFSSQVTDFLIEDHKIVGVEVNHSETILSEVVVLALGHSARDTFEILEKKNIEMVSKSFAVGLRIQHSQKMIDLSQYGEEGCKILPPAEYKTAKTLNNGRGIYSFCMCPGGYVVNASSEKNRLAVNGMSYHDRAGENSNSAMIVTVTPEDFEFEGVLGGMKFQRKLEEKAFQLASGKVPLQLFGDFKKGIPSKELGDLKPEIKGAFELSNVREILPEVLNQSIEEGILAFGKMIQGFDRYDALLAGVESRTSSPIRILRNETFESNILGLYPCGEGAGYAGGITSAAMDGIKVAEAIGKKYHS